VRGPGGFSFSAQKRQILNSNFLVSLIYSQTIKIVILASRVLQITKNEKNEECKNQRSVFLRVICKVAIRSPCSQIFTLLINRFICNSLNGGNPHLINNLAQGNGCPNYSGMTVLKFFAEMEICQ